jgi:hypothetical protein
MKKCKAIILLTAIILTLTLTLTACSPPKEGDTVEDVIGAAEGSADAQLPSVMIGFSSNGTQITPGMPMANVIEKVGEAEDVFEAPSCAFEGVDRIYYYKGFEVNSYPASDGTERVLSVVLRTDEVQTNEGLYIGMSKEDLLSLYPDMQTDDKIGNLHTITSGGTELRVITDVDDADKVIDITIAEAAAQAAVDKANAQ